MLVLTFVSFFIALIITLALCATSKGISVAYGEYKPQRFHEGETSRLGGVGVYVGCTLGWATLLAAPKLGWPLGISTNWQIILAWIACVTPSFAAGLVEDIVQKDGVRWRLASTLASGVIASMVLDLRITRLDIPLVDIYLLNWPWLGVALACVAVAGLPHAFNLIDGYNGLAGTVAVMVAGAVAYVALQLGDRTLAALMLAMVGSTAGFLYWNYPRGMIFAGDGGAYLWGSVIAIGVIRLVQSHSEVSPWFAMLLLIYPVWETLFSIYRKLLRGTSPGVADSLHFHQLVYRRLVRGVFHNNRTRQMMMRNNRTSPYLWGFTLLTVVPATLFWQNTVLLMLFCALFIATYLVAYLTIIRFKVPRWARM